LLPPAPVSADIKIAADTARISNGNLTAEVTADGRLTFRRADGSVLLAECIPHFTGPPQRRYRSAAGGMHQFEVLFDADDGEHFYGLGQHQHGKLNQKGAVVELVQRNTEVS